MNTPYRFLSSLCAFLSLLFIIPLCYANHSYFTIQHLGDGHSILRIDQAKRYLLLPIEEEAREVKASVIVDNHIVKTINVRLAVNKIDYYVPLDLSIYHTKELIVNIQSVPDSAVLWKELELSDTFEPTDKEKYRPLYHFAPSYGWMNDPNGMFYKDGEYHLYYQYNPYGSMWGNMTWGHAVSKDLVKWEHLPAAIYPDGLGAIFSGSCVVDIHNTAGFGKNAVIAFYTSANDRQTQSMAYSLDNGRTFRKYSHNPILTSTVQDFRDPKVFWHTESKQWILILAAGQEMQIYSSFNLKEWTFESSFGEGEGAHGGVWECPDLIQLPVKGTTQKKWVLICNLNPGGPFGGSATQYFVGTFDGKTFKNESATGVTKWMDYGKDHYATVTWNNAPNNRAIAIAWMSNWEYSSTVPTLRFRGSNSIVRELSLYTQDNDIYLSSLPCKEIDALRGKKIEEKSFKVNRVYNWGELFRTVSSTYEINLEIKNKNADVIGFILFNEKGEEVNCYYNLTEKTFSMDRTKSGITAFSKSFPSVCIAPIHHKNTYSLRILVDKASIEIFDSNGAFSITNLVFPTTPYNRLSFYSKGGSFDILSMNLYNFFPQIKQ